MRPAFKAGLPAALRYLAGCRHFEPKGKWVSSPEFISDCIARKRFNHVNVWIWNMAMRNEQLRPKSSSSWTSSVPWSPSQNNPKWICNSMQCAKFHIATMSENLGWTFQQKHYREKTWIDREKVGDDRENSVKNVKKNRKFTKFGIDIWSLFTKFTGIARSILHHGRVVSLLRCITVTYICLSPFWCAASRFGAVAMAASLSNLPFPIDELAWDKLKVVAKHLKVSKAEAFTIMHHVLGPPETPLPATWLYIYIYIYLFIYADISSMIFYVHHL